MEIRTPDELEQHLSDLSAALTAPEPAECVLCYVARMLVSFGCDGTLRWSVRWWIRRAPRANLAPVLDVHGDYCDCEVFRTGWRPAYEPGPPGDGLPRCTHPRIATEPCDNWMGSASLIGR